MSCYCIPLQYFSHNGYGNFYYKRTSNDQQGNQFGDTTFTISLYTQFQAWQIDIEVNLAETM